VPCFWPSTQDSRLLWRKTRLIRNSVKERSRRESADSDLIRRQLLISGNYTRYYLFNIVFSFTYTPLQGVIPAEALETTQRAKGLALSGVLVSGKQSIEVLVRLAPELMISPRIAMGFINQFAGPIALGTIGYKYIYIFVGWDCVETAAWFLFGVESQGRTLEQLEWVYEQPNPVRASLKADKVVVADGHVVSEL
jgi:hypothetical protein